MADHTTTKETTMTLPELNTSYEAAHGWLVDHLIDARPCPEGVRILWNTLRHLWDRVEAVDAPVASEEA